MRTRFKVGGADYGRICALAYRQCLAGHGIAADGNGQPLMFTKENTSNGDIATADVLFPGDPMMLLISPTLAKATLVPLLVYAASDHWKFPNAPHDLGTYPVARGTDDGGEQMPVEESGNFLILCDAICPDRGQHKICRYVVAAADPVDGVLGAVRSRPRRSALHGRLHGASEPQF